eukprot:TRINITY_DN5416_c3_g1_i1.p1 TRINITY_DN5416_c3_g1~~TRINITY_DN5416_c3_g1_i1.p1  ORF type:complete len:162 (+),score=35.17 TRINITY_DN5416_c3_g1_i1:64-549(+)
MSKCTSVTCNFGVTGISPTHCCKLCHMTPGHHGPMCKKQPFKCASCNNQVTGVHPSHCCNKCATHPGQHGPHCQQKLVAAANAGLNLSGTWKNAAGADRVQIQQVGNQFTCTSAAMSWSPAVGTLTGQMITYQTGMTGISGTVQVDGRRIDFSNGCAWVRL